jgi:hypothetical protein
MPAGLHRQGRKDNKKGSFTATKLLLIRTDK